MNNYMLWFQQEVREGHIKKDANAAEFVQTFCNLQADAVRVECDEQTRLRVEACKLERDEEFKTEIDSIQQECEQKLRNAKASSPTQFELKKESREVLRSMGKSITVIDGNDKGALRVWMEGVDRAGKAAKAQGEEVVRFALANARGDLQKVVFAAWEKLGDVSWSSMAAEISATLLTADEESYLRDRVTNMFQLKGETEPNYCRRYWDAVYKAWPRDQMNKQILTMLLSQFADSLKEVQTRWHVKVNSPTTVEEAIRLASSSGRAMESRRHRVEEEMEIGEIKIEGNGQKSERNGHIFKTMQGEIKSLCKKVQRCENVAAAREEAIRNDFRKVQNNDTRGEKRYHNGTVKTQGVPGQTRPPVRCFSCNGPHMVRNCPHGLNIQRINYQRWVPRGRSGFPVQGAVRPGN